MADRSSENSFLLYNNKAAALSTVLTFCIDQTGMVDFVMQGLL